MIKARGVLTGKIISRKILKGKLNTSIKPIYPELENLKITPTMEEQIFNHKNSYGYDEVIVEAIVGEDLEVSPTKELQEFSSLYENVKVNPVTSEIDKNIIAENIRTGINILGVEGTLEEGYKVNVSENILVFSNGGTVKGSELIV